jgi:hypothetical protein
MLASWLMDRRETLRFLGALLAAFAVPRVSHATTARAVTLTHLVARSTRVAHVTPLEASSRFEDIGNTRHIVTYSRLGIIDQIYGSSNESEIWVRTLGGHVDRVAELVNGEAELVPGQASLVFLQMNAEGIEQVTEMAQGQYALDRAAGGPLRVRPSRNLPHLLNTADSAAVVRLSGLPFADARALIQGERR